MPVVHFLIVDDEEMVRRTIARQIRAAHPDCTITEAASGEQALRMLDAGMFFDIFVSDNSMSGGMRGIQFFRETQTRLPRSVRILVTCDQMEPAEVGALIGTGVLFAHFTKPWDSAEFQAAIQRAVRQIVDQETVRPLADRSPIAVHDDDPDAASPYDPEDEVDPWAD